MSNQPPAVAEPAFVRFTFACDRLGISRGYGHELVKRDEYPVPVIKIGRRLMVNAEALEAFIAASA